METKWIEKLGLGQYLDAKRYDPKREAYPVFEPSGACVGYIKFQRLRFRIVNTRNGGAGGRKVEYETKECGVAGGNECLKWVHDNTSFSFDEAIRNQGYVVEPFQSIEEEG